MDRKQPFGIDSLDISSGQVGALRSPSLANAAPSGTALIGRLVMVLCERVYLRRRQCVWMAQALPLFVGKPAPTGTAHAWKLLMIL
jgi:hypothetical protein